MRTTNIAIFAIMLVTQGCNQAQNVFCSDVMQKDAPLEEDVPDEASPAHLLTIERRNITTEKRYPASLEGRQSVKIVPRIDGYLSEVRVKDGDQIKRGQILFVMDQTAFQAEVNVAKANVSIAKTGVTAAQLNYESRLHLREKSIISEHELRVSATELESAKAQLELAGAQLALAQNNLSYTVIRSPFDGVTGRILYRVGDYVGSTLSDGLTTIADTEEIIVHFSLSERDILQRIEEHGSLKGMIEAFPRVFLQLTDGSRYAHDGRIESISGVLDRQTGTLSVRAVFPNPDGMLISGSAGQLIVPTEYKQVIVIPQTATFDILDKTHVYKVVDGRTKSTVVKVVALSDGQNYLVERGLEEGDVIVGSGAAYLHEDMAVEALSENGETEFGEESDNDSGANVKSIAEDEAAGSADDRDSEGSDEH